MTGGEDKRTAPNPSGLRGSLPPSTSSEGFPPANPSGDCSVVKALEGLGVSRANHVDPGKPSGCRQFRTAGSNLPAQGTCKKLVLPGLLSQIHAWIWLSRPGRTSFLHVPCAGRLLPAVRNWRHPEGFPGSTWFARDTPRPSRALTTEQSPEGLAGGKPSELVEGGKLPRSPLGFGAVRLSSPPVTWSPPSAKNTKGPILTEQANVTRVRCHRRYARLHMTIVLRAD